MIAKTKYHTIAESNFSLWFALLSPFNRHLFRHPRRIPPLPLKADTKMKTTRSSILVAEVPGYAELQREMHHALRHNIRSGLRRMANRPRMIITSRVSRSCSLAIECTHARMTTI